MSQDIRILSPDRDDMARCGGRLVVAAAPWAARAWLSRIGPTAFVCWRVMARDLVEAGGPVEVDVGELAERLGVAGDRGTNRMRHTLARLEKFRLITAAPGGWSVRLVLPVLAPAKVRLLPADIRSQYLRGLASLPRPGRSANSTAGERRHVT